MKMDFIVIPNELKDGDVEATGEGDTVFLDANGVVFNVLTPIRKKGTLCFTLSRFIQKPS